MKTNTNVIVNKITKKMKKKMMKINLVNLYVMKIVKHVRD